MSFEENKNNQSSNIKTNDASSENTTENVGSTIENLNAPDTADPVSDAPVEDSGKPKSFSFDSFKGFERKKSKREIAQEKAAEKASEDSMEDTAAAAPEIGNDIENLDPVSEDAKAPEEKTSDEAESAPKRKRFFGLPKRDKKSNGQDNGKSEESTT